MIFITVEQRRSNVLTTARIQPFCKKHNNRIGCNDEFRVCPGNITQRIKALLMQTDHFCLIWESIKFQ